MSYNLITDYNIRFVADCPTHVLFNLQQWSDAPYDHKVEGLLIDKLFGKGIGKWGSFEAQADFRKHDDGHYWLKTKAMFSRGSLDRPAAILLPLIDMLKPFIENKNDVLAVVRGEDCLHDFSSERGSMWWGDEEQEPDFRYNAVTIRNGVAHVEWTSGDLYKLCPWVEYAY